MSQNRAESTGADRVCRLDGEMAEISLLLPAWQVTALERLAGSRGLTPGQLIRSLIQQHLACRVIPDAAGSRDGKGPGRRTD